MSDLITRLQVALQGKKTYLISFLLVLVGLVRFVSGDIGIAELLASPDVLVLLNGLGLAALRDGIASVAKAEDHV